MLKSPQLASEDNTPCYLTYTSYDDLPPVSSSQICTLTLRELINPIEESEPSQWTEQFIAVTKLRIIHKYLPAFFYKIFNFIFKKTSKLLQTSPPKLGKNIIYLLNEVFSRYQDETSAEYGYVVNYLNCFLPLIIKKTDIVTNSLIKSSCLECIETVQDNMLYFDVLIILLNIIKNNKKISVGKKCIEMFTDIIKNIPFFYFEDISSKYMTQLVEKIVEMFQLRSSFHMKVCFSIIDMFLNTHFDLMRCIDSQEVLENYRMVIKAKEEMNETKMKIAKEINLSKDRIHYDKLNYVFSFN